MSFSSSSLICTSYFFLMRVVFFLIIVNISLVVCRLLCLFYRYDKSPHFYQSAFVVFMQHYYDLVVEDEVLQ